MGFLSEIQQKLKIKKMYLNPLRPQLCDVALLPFVDSLQMRVCERDCETTDGHGGTPALGGTVPFVVDGGACLAAWLCGVLLGVLLQEDGGDGEALLHPALVEAAFLLNDLLTYALMQQLAVGCELVVRLHWVMLQQLIDLRVELRIQVTVVRFCICTQLFLRPLQHFSLARMNIKQGIPFCFKWYPLR